MTTAIESTSVPPASRPLFLAMIGILTLSLACAVLLEIWVGIAVLAIGLFALSRPLDPFMAAVVTACAATFVNYDGGRLTQELGIITFLTLYTLLCTVLSAHRGRWGMPRGGLTKALGFFGATTAVSLVLAVVNENSPKYLGLDLSPLLGFILALVVGGLSIRDADLRQAMFLLILTGLGHVALGAYAYATIHSRTGGIYFTPVPALLALVIFNLAIRHRDARIRMSSAVLIGAFMVHQFISYTRGYWMGLIVSIPLSIALYIGRGPGAKERALGAFRFVSFIGVLSLAGLLFVASVLGWSHLFETLGTRLVSSVVVKQSSESASNIFRLIEYSQVWNRIIASPWLGYGIGYTILIRQPIMSMYNLQGMFHQVYLWIWLKEGIPGLVAMVGVLVTACRIGIRAATRLQGDAAGWAAAAAACTVHLSVVGLTHYPFAQVNSTFPLALIWGIALTRIGVERSLIVWRVPLAAVVPDPAPSEPGR